MVAKVSAGGGGSCKGLADYLEKETKGEWFNQRQEWIEARPVVDHLDANRRNLGQEEAKFYQLVLSPSDKELAHIGSDEAKLQAYTRAMMEQYAQNFNKGITSQDLVWYAKIEDRRHYSHQDRAVQTGEMAPGQAKGGRNTHIHVLVSRTEDLDRFKAGRQSGEITRKHPLKLSPVTNHRHTEGGAVKGGFDRVQFKGAAEQVFDQQFGYHRPLTETFAYANTLAHGSEYERQKMRRAAHELAARQAKPAQAQQLHLQVSVEPLKTSLVIAPTEEPPRPVVVPSLKPQPPETDRPAPAENPAKGITHLNPSQQELIRRLLTEQEEPRRQGLKRSGPKLT